MATLIGEVASHVITRTYRRLLVAGVHLAGAGFIVLYRLEAESMGMEIAMALLTFIAFLGYVVVAHLTHHARTNPASLLDERGREVRHRAYYWSYRIMIGLVMVVMYAMLFAYRMKVEWMPHDTRGWAGVMAVLGILMISLPPSMIAWTEPDLPADSPEDAEERHQVLRGVDLPLLQRRFNAGLLAATWLLTAVQYAGVGPLPTRYNYMVASGAAGALIGALLMWNRNRESQE